MSTPQSARELPNQRLRLGLLVAASLILAIAATSVTMYLNEPQPKTNTADQIEQVDWRHVAIELPASPELPCPHGLQQMQPIEQSPSSTVAATPTGGGKSYLVLDQAKIAYGDLTGDGRPEAVVPIRCTDLPTSMLDEFQMGGQLLVVSMRDDRSLAGLGYAGPAKAVYRTVKIENGEILTSVWYENLENQALISLPAPSHLRAYQWDGKSFHQTRGRTTPLVLTPSQGGTGSEVELATILGVTGTACPGDTVQFVNQQANSGGYQFHIGGSMYAVDVDNDGNEELLTGVQCSVGAGSLVSLYLFGQAADRFETIDVPIANGGQFEIQDGWYIAGSVLTVKVKDLITSVTTTHKLTWTGDHFDKRLGSYRPL